MISVSKTSVTSRRGITDGGGGYDLDALAFIQAWELATSDTMADNQKAVVNNTVLMLKGNGTVNGSNVWTLLSGGNSVILPYVPKDDSTAYLQGYALDLLTANTVVTWYNFLSSDPLPSGLKGSGYGVLNIQPNLFGQDNVTAGYYLVLLDSISNNKRILGTPTFFTNTINGVGNQPTQFNSSVRTDFTGLSPIGVNSITRDGTNTVKKYNNGVLAQTLSNTANSHDGSDIFLYAQNNGSGSVSSSGINKDVVGGWHFTDGLTDVEIADFHEAIQYLNDNIITGGR